VNIKKTYPSKELFCSAKKERRKREAKPSGQKRSSARMIE
jgi:hypothetical protein